MDGLYLSELSTFFSNIIKEDIPINNRPKAVFLKVEGYLKDKNLLDKVALDFVDIMHFCVFELVLSHKVYISKPNDAFQFVRQYENISFFTLAGGAFISGGAFSMLKQESTRRKRHDELQILAKDVVDLYLTFGYFEDAFRKNSWFINEHSMNLGSFAWRLTHSINLLKKRLYSEKVQQAIKDNNCDNFPNDEYFAKLANKKFKEYISKQKVDFLYQLQPYLDDTYLRHSVSLRLRNLTDLLIGIVDELEKKEALSFISGINDQKLKECCAFLTNNTTKEYIKDNLRKTLSSFIYSLIDQAGEISENDDYSKQHVDQTIDAIKNSVNYLYKIVSSSNQSSIKGLVSQLDVFEKEYLVLLSFENLYDYRSFVGSYKSFFYDLLNECIIKKNEDLFEYQLKKRFEELDDESIEKYCKRSMDFFGGCCSVPEMTIAELDNKVPFYNYTDHPYHHSIDEMYKFIKNNKKICNAIAMSQKLIEELGDITIHGDYTFYNVGHIKAVERLLKEILVKYYSHNIYKADKTGKYDNNPILRVPTVVDDLCKKPTAFELGAVAFAMTHILCIDRSCSIPGYNGIFKAPYRVDSYGNYIVSGGCIPFWKHFVSESRNGYFHIEQIESYEESVEIYRLTSYWLTRVIDEMLDAHPGTALD